MPSRGFFFGTNGYLGGYWDGPMEVIVTIVSKLGYNLFRGTKTTYLYWGYNLVTKYHGHPSTPLED